MSCEFELSFQALKKYLQILTETETFFRKFLAPCEKCFPNERFSFVYKSEPSQDVVRLSPVNL